ASGTFTGLSEGGTITVGGRSFSITYNGGTSGHDVVLTAQSSGGVSIVNGFPALNANPNNDPQFSYINSTSASATHQHSMVESVVYSFSAPVNLSASDFTLTNVGTSFDISGAQFTTYHPGVAVVGSQGNKVWTVTFTGDGVHPNTHSIGDGKYRLVLN